MIDTLCMANGWRDTTWRLWVEGFMIPSRLEYRCIKSGVGYGGTEELGTVVTEFDSRHFDNILSTTSPAYQHAPRWHLE